MNTAIIRSPSTFTLEPRRPLPRSQTWHL